ncbi:MAG: hypothetical protein E6J68_10570 [Deltaproteobacteria bacterium]|nr:MAG: hypothetical protein E6J68_10570 [Deltaproteobacteria bacterium]
MKACDRPAVPGQGRRGGRAGGRGGRGRRRGGRAGRQADAARAGVLLLAHLHDLVAGRPLRRVHPPAGPLLHPCPCAILVLRHEREAVCDLQPAVLAAVARLRRHSPSEHQDRPDRRHR